MDMSWKDANRTANAIQLRIVRFGGRINGTSYLGTPTNAFKAGDVLTMGTATNKVATLPSTIDDNITSPVKYLAMQDYDGVSGSERVVVQEINRDTVFEAQVRAGSASNTSNRYGVLVKDGTTGRYSVDLSSVADASLELVDIEPNFERGKTKAEGNYNMVWFRFLPDVLDIIPTPASS